MFESFGCQVDLSYNGRPTKYIGIWHDSDEFPGPQLGDSVWLCKGPSVAVSRNNRRISVGVRAFV